MIAGKAVSLTELIAFGVIQLDAVASDGELVPMTVLIDPGSNSTLFREGDGDPCPEASWEPTDAPD